MNLPKFLLPGVGASMALAACLLPAISTGASVADAPMVAALQDLQSQQLLIAANQTKIDAQLAVITEDLRVARLYVARAGGKKKQP